MTSPDQRCVPPPEPLGLLRRWLDEAAAVTVPGAPPGTAAVLATVSADAQPTTRAVEVRACDGRGLVFFANLNSRKGRDLRARPAAAATLYWPSAWRQVNLAGHVVFTSDGESDGLWATRSPWSQAVATVSDQGAPLRDEAALRTRVQDLAAPARPLPRPAGHGGFVLVPAAIEFWQGDPDRIHRRWHYQRAGDGWSNWLLQP
jgi:pyridoxamine 5'-phosphate oxidase